MKRLCLLVLFAAALDMQSSALAAGQGGLLAKLKQARSVSEGVSLLRRAVARASVDGASGKLAAAALALGMLFNVAVTADAATCLGCEEPPAPKGTLAAEQVNFRFSPLWHGFGGFPDDGAAETLFSNHYAIVPREGIEYVHFVLNDIGDANNTVLTINFPDGWQVATDDIDGDGGQNIIAWYYNHGWQRITSWDNAGVTHDFLTEIVDPAWFDMPGGGTWDGVQFSVQVAGRAAYVFDGKTQHEQIEAGIRPTFGAGDDHGERSLSMYIEPIAPLQGGGKGETHYLRYVFRGLLPGDVDIDGFYSWRDLQYLQWRVWWGWNHINEGPNGGKDNYLWDVNEDGAINNADIDKLNEIMASGSTYGGAPAAIPMPGGSIAFSPSPGANYSPDANRPGTSISPNARPPAVRPDGKAATTWGELKKGRQ